MDNREDEGCFRDAEDDGKCGWVKEKGCEDGEMLVIKGEVDDSDLDNRKKMKKSLGGKDGGKNRCKGTDFDARKEGGLGMIKMAI